MGQNSHKVIINDRFYKTFSNRMVILRVICSQRRVRNEFQSNAVSNLILNSIFGQQILTLLALPGIDENEAIKDTNCGSQSNELNIRHNEPKEPNQAVGGAAVAPMGLPFAGMRSALKYCSIMRSAIGRTLSDHNL